MALAFVVGIALMTLAIGVFGVRVVRSTSDFLVAARSVPPWLNATAIAGEFLSMSSFLGIAGLVLKTGIGALWYMAGSAAGLLALLVLVAGPLRRSGAFTVPDFAEARLGSARVRKLAGVVVLVIVWLYLAPQLKGAGEVLQITSGTPYWIGVAGAGAAIAGTVAMGGMRSATYVQAFQYVVKLIFIAVPAAVLLAHSSPEMRSAAVQPGHGTVFTQATTVRFDVPTVLHLAAPATVTTGAGPPSVWPAGTHQVPAGTALMFSPGTPVPRVDDAPELGGPQWSWPLYNPTGTEHPLFATWSLLLAVLFGTIGLPHVLMRFHTSMNGRDARRAAAVTVGLVGVFFLFPGMFGLLGRVATPDLYLTGRSDMVTLALPDALLPPPWADLLTAVIAAGAYAAFLSTSTGLLLVLSSGISHDLRPGTLRDLRWTTTGAAAVGVLLALPVQRLDISVLVSWAFAVSASTLCPLLVLGVWWRGLTAVGAGAGLVVGAVASVGAVTSSVALPVTNAWPRMLLSQPAVWTVPLTFATMIMVSRISRPPEGAEHLMLAMHLPDPFRDRVETARTG